MTTEVVGGIVYEVSYDTSRLISGQRQVQATNRETASTFDLVEAKLTSITRAISIYAAAMAVVKAANTADDMRLLAARVQVAAGSVEQATVAMGELVAISERTQTSVAANASVFQRLNGSIRQMGGTQADTLRVTELMAMAIKTSGASATEASAAMLQFGQALGSGKLQGDELRSLSENAPYLMQKLADAMGVPIGQLKQLGAEGKLTSDVIVSALTKAGDTIRADFAKLGPTLAGQWQVFTDAMGRAVQKADELTGTSAQLTGAIKGVTTIVERLAQLFGAANDKAGDLGRNEQVKSWADGTARVLSYVVDAADFVARGFRQMGTALGGLAAAGTTLASGGGLAASRDILRQMATDINAIGNAPLAGQQIRSLIDAGAGGGRGFVNPQPPASALKPPAPAAGTGSTFDATGYLAGLEAKTKEGLEKVEAIEREALAKNKALLDQGKINREQYAEGVRLIEVNAAQERLKIQLDQAEGVRQAIEKGGEDEIRVRKQIEDQINRTVGITIGDDPVAQLQYELERKSALLAEYAEKDQENAALYAAARVRLEQDTQRRIAEIAQRERNAELDGQAQVLSSYAGLFSNLSSATEQWSGRQSALFRTMFAASKAFAIAEAVIKIQQGIANAAALPYPANLGAIASVIAATSSIVSTIQSVNYGGGRLYGGDTSAGRLYQINEAGRPEMFTARNGAQYMLPTADGRVTPADQLSGGGGISILVNNYAGGVSVTPSFDQQTRTVTIAVAEVASQIRANSGEVWTALRTSTNVQGRL